MLVAVVSLALAGPTRCVATWTGPVAACSLRGEVAGTATASSAGAAERAAKRQLATVISLSATAMQARIPNLSSAEFSACSEQVSAAYLNCFEDLSLAGEALCFAELADPECWTGDVLSVEDVGWRALEVGRKELCAKVDARLVSLNYSDLEKRRAVCAASCQAKATVRCAK